MNTISEGLANVQQRLKNALLQAGRPADSARLIAVSKTFPADAVAEAYSCGQRAFGENRVQELQQKCPILPQEIEWHLIGHLQQNKVRHALEFASWIHSVDTLPLLKRIETIADEMGKSPKLLLEINISGEESKFGLAPEEVPQVLSECPSRRLAGFMTVAPADASPEELHSIFKNLRCLRDAMETQFNLKLPELSMGMSSDFEIAIAEGATMIRVGSAIFGHRAAKAIIND